MKCCIFGKDKHSLSETQKKTRSCVFSAENSSPPLCFRDLETKNNQMLCFGDLETEAVSLFQPPKQSLVREL